MKLSIIGGGGIGSALATLFVRYGHRVVIGSRRPESVDPAVRQLAAGVVTYREAAASAEVVFLCVPWEHLDGALNLLGDLSGKIVVDASNPETADGRALAEGHSTSGAEIIAGRLAGARVVKAFNYVYAELLKDAGALGRLRPSIFFCGDDRTAKERVSSLIISCGLEPVDCGALENARYLEPLALLMVQLVRVQGWPPAGAAMKLVHD